MATETMNFAPVRGKARYDVMDVLRGIAILGILYMNIPFMGSLVSNWMSDPRRLGWTPIDQSTFAFIQVFWEGTQRGLFEVLFGAGVLIFTARAMKPDDPVHVADLYYRRNLLLVAFGLIDIFLVCWVGDILFVYGLAALVVFPFRKAPPKLLLALGMAWATVSFVGWPGGGGIIQYESARHFLQEEPSLRAQQKAGVKLDEEVAARLERVRKQREALDLSKPRDKEDLARMKAEATAHAAGPFAFMRYSWGLWNKIFGDGNGAFFAVLEALSGMFLGMALFKWGVIQGQRTARFYALLALCAYAVGLTLRGIATAEIMSFRFAPPSMMFTGEFSRLAVTLGHVGLFNLVMKSAAGRNLFAPFKAAGRMAFSIYVATSLVTLWFVFAPWGLDLWNTMGWAKLTLTATVINAVMLVAANLWMRFFVYGPLEWCWRSLTYWKRQPFRRPRAEPAAPAESGPPQGGDTAPLPDIGPGAPLPA